ncbi:hypothetical protein AN958_05094 [Leucoagaricus sp. SymC.cos]|nr:hypothetical protein AN958_05094 [Leucoagaricus sp. SymC.cos]
MYLFFPGLSFQTLTLCSSAALFWCLISSCLGVSLRQALSNNVQTARSNPYARVRGQRVEDELWEMEYRGLARG